MESENLGLDEPLEDSTKYNFDYYALSKLKKQHRQRITALSIVVIILLIVLIVFVTMYMKSSCSSNNGKTLKAVKIEAYKRIAKYGEDCRKAPSQCSVNSYCTYLQGTYRCECNRGYIGDGIGECKDVDFSINFVHRTIQNIPKLKSVKFPKSNGLSVCTWFKLNGIPDGWKALFMYATYDIDGENDLMLWFFKDKMAVSLTDKEPHTGKIKFKNRKWTHVCWTWISTGEWKIYMNGRIYYEYKSNLTHFTKPFPESTGTILLGQDIDGHKISDPEQMFEGEITSFFIYNTTLDKRQVMSSYQNHPPVNNIIVGWWQFKNKTHGSDIVTASYPFNLFPKR